MILAADTSCRSLSLFIVLLHINFHAYPFIQKNLGPCGPDNVDWIKRVLGPIVFVCRSHSAKKLYSAVDLYSAADLYSTANPFPLHLFLWTSLALWSSWQAFEPCFSLGFLPHGTDSKMGINIQPLEHMNCSYDSYAKTYAVFFRGLFHNSHADASLLFFAGLLFQSLLSLGKSFSFFLQIHDPPKVAKKGFFSFEW